jgi:hypothetical protein
VQDRGTHNFTDVGRTHVFAHCTSDNITDNVQPNAFAEPASDSVPDNDLPQHIADHDITHNVADACLVFRWNRR